MDARHAGGLRTCRRAREAIHFAMPPVKPHFFLLTPQHVVDPPLIMNCKYGLLSKTLIALTYPTGFFSPTSDTTKSYIEEDDEKDDQSCYRCVLCDVGGMTSQAVKYHCGDKRHQQKETELKNDMTRAMVSSLRVCRVLSDSRFRELDSLQSQILHVPSRDAVYAEMFHYIVNPDFESVEEEKDLRKRKFKKLKMCLATERLVLLGLAVWKAKCIQEMPDATTGYFATQEWVRSGWKSVKEAQSGSNAVTVVVASVRSFLDE
jgi:hypothetical protein